MLLLEIGLIATFGIPAAFGLVGIISSVAFPIAKLILRE